MAIFKISQDKSVLSIGADAFASDNVGPDTLIVDPGAFLIATNDIGGDGAQLGPNGVWNVTINGSVVSTEAAGLFLEIFNPAVSTISIGADGQVAGKFGIDLSSSAIVKNAGVVAGADEGIRLFFQGTRTITNSGTISGATHSIYDFDGKSADKITNSGTLNGKVDLGGGDDTLVNSGTINGRIELGEGATTFTGKNTLSNTGTINGNITGGFFVDDAITNTKTIVGVLDLGGGTNSVTNSGYLIWILSSGNAKVVNSGTIDGLVNLSGTNTLTNSGMIALDYAGGSGVDTVTNTGTILGKIDLRDGDDKFSGGGKVETVLDGNGADTIKLGGGNDVYLATGSDFGFEGVDKIDGGAGIDLYDASAATTSLDINLDVVGHTVAGAGFTPASTAAGSDVSQDKTDTITGIENATGGSAQDNIYGTAGANVLDGRGGVDRLLGFGGNDTLIGGSHLDVLIGGIGRDTLTGGGGNDFYQYATVAESGPTRATRDIITDFSQADGDKLDIDLIDANTKVVGNQDFFFVGTNMPTGFSGTPGELHVIWSAEGQIVEGDVNGDKKADFAVEVIDPTHAITFVGGDFFQV